MLTWIIPRDDTISLQVLSTALHQQCTAWVQVEAGKRRDMYQRNQLLHKIQDETEKARSLLDARAQLQQQRKMANMGASFQRQKLLQAMEKLQTSKDWAKNGTVNMDSLLRANH